MGRLTGGSWQALGATIPGFSPGRERDVITVGPRDLEPDQRARLSTGIAGQAPT